MNFRLQFCKALNYNFIRLSSSRILPLLSSFAASGWVRLSLWVWGQWICVRLWSTKAWCPVVHTRIAIVLIITCCFCSVSPITNQNVNNRHRCLNKVMRHRRKRPNNCNVMLSQCGRAPWPLWPHGNKGQNKTAVKFLLLTFYYQYLSVSCLFLSLKSFSCCDEML